MVWPSVAVTMISEVVHPPGPEEVGPDVEDGFVVVGPGVIDEEISGDINWLVVWLEGVWVVSLEPLDVEDILLPGETGRIVDGVPEA